MGLNYKFISIVLTVFIMCLIMFKFSLIVNNLQDNIYKTIKSINEIKQHDRVSQRKFREKIFKKTF